MTIEQITLRRRKHSRIPVDWLTSVSIPQHPAGHSSLEGKVKNVGDGGIGIIVSAKTLPERLLNHRLVRLKLQAESVELPLTGRVVWSAQSDQLVEYGLAFQDPVPEMRSNLQELIFLDRGYVSKLGYSLLSNGWPKDEKHEQVEREIEVFFAFELTEFIKKLILWQKETENLEKYSDYHVVSLINTSESLLQKINEIEKMVPDRALRKGLRRAFRNATANWAYTSELVKRGYEKPLGYPGDYYMLELIYNNRRTSSGFGAYWDGYFLNDPYAHAVRNRKDLMKQIIQDFLDSTKAAQPRILNLASGSCREIRELYANENRFQTTPIFTCVDQDEESIKFAQTALSINREKPSIVFIKENILHYARYPERYFRGLLGQDLVYSIGLADYLPDKILQGLITFAYKVLRKKGKLVLAHKDCDTHAPLAPKWYCDWEFIPRIEGYFLKLIRDAGIAEPVITTRDKTKHIFFVTIQKCS